MPVIRLILVWSACLAIGSSNAWCMCCALLCNNVAAAQAVVEATPAKSCCGKKAAPAQDSTDSPVCPVGQADCEKCDRAITSDPSETTAKPPSVETHPFSPFLTGEAFSSSLVITTGRSTVPVDAHCDPSPGSTLLALQCALNL